jgi:hypothetical protein
VKANSTRGQGSRRAVTPSDDDDDDDCLLMYRVQQPYGTQEQPNMQTQTTEDNKQDKKTDN